MGAEGREFKSLHPDVERKIRTKHLHTVEPEDVPPQILEIISRRGGEMDTVKGALSVLAEILTEYNHVIFGYPHPGSSCIGCPGLSHRTDCPEWTFPL